MIHKQVLGFFVLALIGMVILPLNSFAQKSYLNDTETIYTIAPGTPKLFSLSTNLTLQDNINHTFEGRLTTNFFRYNVKYVAGDNSGFLLYLRFQGQAGNNDQIRNVSCTDGTVNTIFTGSSAATEFDNFHNFTVFFDVLTNTSKIFIDWQEVASTAVCSNFNDVGSINFTSDLSGQVKNIIVLANNKPPQFNGNLPNITWDEDTSTSFNISGNFTDANNDSLKYTYMGVENISISINNATGIVNLTPNQDFYGINYVIFIANDSSNVTLSNNVTLNVTNVNDAPNITSASITNTDFLNRTNGTLTASWTFSDVDNASMAGNETLWYNNGVENESLRNLITVSSSNTTKNQNWSFSVRVSDGTNFSSFVSSENLTIENDIPAVSDVFLNNTDFLNRTNGTLTASWIFADIDNEIIISNETVWYINGIENESFRNQTSINSGNTTKGQNWTFSVRVFDGTNFSAFVNSSNITISNSAPLFSGPIFNQTWDEDTPLTINISGNFTDMDNDNRAYNYTSVSNIAVSIINDTGIATLTPDADFFGTRNTIFYASDGIEIAESNNITLAISDVAEPSSDSPSGGGGGATGGGGGGGKSGWQCRYKAECSEWSLCADGKQMRECTNAAVAPFYSDTECDYLQEKETERKCAEPVTCSDSIKNQGEEEADCGGPCEPCPAIQAEEEKTEEDAVSTGPTGAVVAAPFGNVKKYGWIALAILAVIGVFSYNKLRKKPQEIPKNKEVDYEALFKLIDK